MSKENKEQLEFTVIMPALNEEKNIQAAIYNTLGTLNDFNINGEIIVINDGSNDKTELLVKSIISENDCIRIISHNIPYGLGASFWDGVDNAKGAFIVVIPGDNENTPWEIFRYYKLLEHVDIVIPFIFNMEVRPLFRRVLSIIYRSIVNTTFVVNFNYTNGTVLYRKSLLKELDYRSKSFFFQTDILVRSIKKGYLYAEVPYKINIRKEGKSKAFSFPSFIQVVKGYLRLLLDYYFKRNVNFDKRYANGSLTATRRHGQGK